MSSKAGKKAAQGRSPSAQPAEVQLGYKQRVLMAAEFRQHQAHLRQNLHEMQDISQPFFAALKQYRSDRSVEHFAEALLAKEVEYFKGDDPSLEDLLVDEEHAKELYLDRWLMYEFADLRGFYLLESAVSNGMVELPPQIMDALKECLRTHRVLFPHPGLAHPWYSTIPRLLEELYRERFRIRQRDLWLPIRKAIVACGLLADIIESSTDQDGPYEEPYWFREVYGILAERLRAAHRQGRLKAIKVGHRWRYSLPSAQGIWSEVIPAKDLAVPTPPANPAKPG